MDRGARISGCGNYRYSLSRTWGDREGVCTFIGLNPSTADAVEDDPTIRRCIRFARDWGYDSLLMLNAYAFRATDPKCMMQGKRDKDSPVVTNDVVGPDNDYTLRHIMLQSDLIIAAWGNNIDANRERAVLECIKSQVFCLGKTKTGKPKHPLYIKADKRPELFFDGMNLV